MKKLILALSILLLSLTVYGQSIIPRQSGTNGVSDNNLRVLTTLSIPSAATPPVSTFYQAGSIRYNSVTSKLEVYNGSIWVSYVTSLDLTAYTPSSRTLTGGVGILAIGDLSANRTVAADTAGILVSKTFAATKYASKNSANTITGINTFQSGANNSITTPDNRVEYSNPTASTAITLRQTSPSDKWSASAWNTSTLASQTVFWESYIYGNSGNPVTSTWQLKATNNGLASFPFSVTDDGTAAAAQFKTGNFNTALVKANGSGTFVAAVAGTDYSAPTPIIEITGTTQSANANTIYIPHNASQTTITAPSATVIGSLVQVIGEGAGGWKLQLPAGYTIQGVGGFTTTSGGSVSSTDRYCTITIRLVATNKFVVTTSQGTLTPL